MIRTQIQLPNDLYYQLKAIAEEKEWSLAEVIRRGAEYMTRVYPFRSKKKKEWQLPAPFNLGTPEIHYSEWRMLANERDWEDHSKSVLKKKKS